MKNDTSKLFGLKTIKLEQLESHELDELRQITTQFGDATIINDSTTLQTLYEISKKAMKSASVARKKAGEKLENFVMSAAATRQLFYRQHQRTEQQKQVLATKLAAPEEPAGKRKKKRSGERTEIFE